VGKKIKVTCPYPCNQTLERKKREGGPGGQKSCSSQNPLLEKTTGQKKAGGRGFDAGANLMMKKY